MDSESDETSVSDLKTMMIRMIKEFRGHAEISQKNPRE
jgi:hypothetical protein